MKKYYKHISNTNFITVYGSSKDILATYQCTSVFEKNSYCWAKVITERPELGYAFVEFEEITEEEYQGHVKFALKLISDKLENHYTLMKPQIKSGQIFDYRDYEN